MTSLRSIIRTLFLAALVVALPASAGAQQPVDPHALYERHCATCHTAHAGDFAVQSLERDIQGRVTGHKTGCDLQAFLARGHGRLAADEVAVMTAHLTGILNRDLVFHDKCRACHDRAVTFARERLIVRNDRLVGRYSDIDVATFLVHHGRLETDEIPIVVDALKYQLRPVQTGVHY